MAYNVVEASVALWSGAAADSVALFGFGLQSVIETAAAEHADPSCGSQNPTALDRRSETLGVAMDA